MIKDKRVDLIDGQLAGAKILGVKVDNFPLTESIRIYLLDPYGEELFLKVRPHAPEGEEAQVEVIVDTIKALIEDPVDLPDNEKQTGEERLDNGLHYS